MALGAALPYMCKLSVAAAVLQSAASTLGRGLISKLHEMQCLPGLFP